MAKNQVKTIIINHPRLLIASDLFKIGDNNISNCSSYLLLLTAVLPVAPSPLNVSPLVIIHVLAITARLAAFPTFLALLQVEYALRPRLLVNVKLYFNILPGDRNTSLRPFSERSIIRVTFSAQYQPFEIESTIPLAGDTSWDVTSLQKRLRERISLLYMSRRFRQDSTCQAFSWDELNRLLRYGRRIGPSIFLSSSIPVFHERQRLYSLTLAIRGEIHHLRQHLPKYNQRSSTFAITMSLSRSM